MSTVSVAPLATRSPARLVADPSRVIAMLFVPGHQPPSGPGARIARVLEFILSLDDDEVAETLAGIVDRFGGRHREVQATFRRHAERITSRLETDVELSESRTLLLGAAFTQEYAVQAAALCNPSAVALPDQSGVPAGSLRFVMSVRQIGEGHRSSVGFRTGTVDERGAVAIDEPGPFTTAGTIGTVTMAAATFQGLARRLSDDSEATAWVLAGLGSEFTIAELNARLTELESQDDTRRNVGETVGRLRVLANRTYSARFPATAELSERVLYPAAAAESSGIEDARFVRFVEDDGVVTYYGTYAGFDGRAIVQQLLSTTDFQNFSASPLHGQAATDKGLALFPRRVGGRFVALSRFDGARNAVAFSDNLHLWPTAEVLDLPTTGWAAIQSGNCGAPIETEEGWLVLTHGVGPMRTYSMGACLLDLDDPSRVLGQLPVPLLTPQADEQNGYVPNVVYSCGSLVHNGTLVIPYGIGDAAIGFATVRMTELLAAIPRHG